MAGFHIFRLFASFAEYKKSHFKADWKASELQRSETSFRAFNHWNACLDSFCMSSQQNSLQGDYPLVSSMKWVGFVASPLGSYSSQNPSVADTTQSCCPTRLWWTNFLTVQNRSYHYGMTVID